MFSRLFQNLATLSDSLKWEKTLDLVGSRKKRISWEKKSRCFCFFLFLDLIWNLQPVLFLRWFALPPLNSFTLRFVHLLRWVAVVIAVVGTAVAAVVVAAVVSVVGMVVVDEFATRPNEAHSVAENKVSTSLRNCCSPFSSTTKFFRRIFFHFCHRVFVPNWRPQTWSVSFQHRK